MTSDDSTKKSEPTPKAASTTKSESTPKAASTPSQGASEAEGKAPSNYSRGEKQKPVTGSYKDNWNIIFGKKKKTKRKSSR
jgi:hypothetical protein